MGEIVGEIVGRRHLMSVHVDSEIGAARHSHLRWSQKELGRS